MKLKVCELSFQIHLREKELLKNRATLWTAKSYLSSFQNLDASLCFLDENGTQLSFADDFELTKLWAFAALQKLGHGDWELLQIWSAKKGLGFVAWNWVLKTVNTPLSSGKKIFLEVSENNIEAQVFYKRIGFEQYAIRRHYYSDRSHALCMSYDLKS